MFIISRYIKSRVVGHVYHYDMLAGLETSLAVYRRSFRWYHVLV